MASINTRTRRLLWLLALVTTLAAIWHFSGLSVNHRENDLGFSEEAKRNPLLGASWLWEKRGLNFYFQRGLDAFDEIADAGNQTIMVSSTSHQLTPEQDQALWQWIAQGGHLISNVIGDVDADNQYIQDPWLQRVGLRAKLYPEREQSDLLSAALLTNQCNCCRKDNLTGIINGHPVTLASTELAYLVDPKNQAHISFEREGRIELIQVGYGKGKVTFVSDLTVWNNKSIDCHDHAFVLTQLVGKHDIWAIQHTELPSFFALLWQYAKLAVLLALFTLMAWLWHQSRRLGPILASSALIRRGLLEYLHASSLFAWNHRQIMAQIQALQQQILLRMALHYPGFRELDQPSQYQLIAERCQLDNQQVMHAMLVQEVRKKSSLISLVQLLQHIRNKV